MDYIVHKAIELKKLSAKARDALAAKEEWVISPKYDGCHAIICFEDGKHVGTWSRSGERVLSLDTVASQLTWHYDLSQGRIAVCGEAWQPGLKFNEISGMFRRQSPQPLGFVPFDMVPFDWACANPEFPVLGVLDGRQYPAPYSKRALSLYEKFKSMHSLVIKPRPLVYYGTFTDALQFSSYYATQNKTAEHGEYDGAILADGQGRYVVGAGTGGEFIKCKPLLSETVTVTTTYPDVGEKTGKNTLALGFTLDGKDQKVSTGLTQAEVDAYTTNPDRIIGQRIEVEAMGKTVNGLLREPRFKGIRNDA